MLWEKSLLRFLPFSKPVLLIQHKTLVLSAFVFVCRLLTHVVYEFRVYKILFGCFTEPECWFIYRVGSGCVHLGRAQTQTELLPRQRRDECDITRETTVPLNPSRLVCVSFR